MGISINTNIAASRRVSFWPVIANLQKSLDRLSSGRRITEPADDAGGLAVAMKLNHSIRADGASKNIANAISFLQVQDGLASAGEIVSRMGELQECPLMY